MKKLNKLFGFFLLSLSLASCNFNKSNPSDIRIYAPDGAPALGLSYLMSEDLFDESVKYEIVDSSLISTLVTGENPNADLAIIPSNLALSNQSVYKNYQILGSITHGNLYILSPIQEEITSLNLESVIGKTIGVININNVPGIITKIVLDKHQIPYNVINNDGKIDENKVNLVGIDAAQIGVDESMQYYVAAEPAASLKTKLLASKGLKIVGNLQDLYSETSSYIQAVVVARRSLIEQNETFIKKFISKIKLTESYLSTCDINDVINNVQAHLTDGLAPTFNEKNLNSQTIKNCNVYFAEAKDIKEQINDIKKEYSAYLKVLEDIGNYLYE